METKIKIEIDNVNDACSIISQKFYQGEKLGLAHRRAYAKTHADVENLKNDMPDDFEKIMQLWGIEDCEQWLIDNKPDASVEA